MDKNTTFSRTVIWKISLAWATRSHQCNLLGITTKCGGSCCSSPSFWPPKASYEANKNKDKEDEWVKNGVGIHNPLHACFHLGPQGCNLSLKDRPIKCLLFPLILNSHNKLVCNNWITTDKGICKGNHNKGPMIIDVIRGNLIELFGVDQVNRVRVEFMAGIDSYFNVPPKVYKSYLLENVQEQDNVIPTPRSLHRHSE